MTPEEGKALADQMRQEVRSLQWVPSVFKGWHAIPPGQRQYWASIRPEGDLGPGRTYRMTWAILRDTHTRGMDVLAAGVCNTVEEAKRAAGVAMRQQLGTT